MSRWGALIALALALCSQAALAQKATKPRVVVLEVQGDRRDKLRAQLEAALKKTKQVQIVTLRQYEAAAGKEGLKGAEARTSEAVGRLAPGLQLDGVVAAKAGRSLTLVVLGSKGEELWTKSVKLQKGKISASDARRLAAGIAITVAKPPPSLMPPEEPATPTEPATPPATPTEPATPPVAEPSKPPPPSTEPVAEPSKPPAEPAKPAPATPPVVATPKPSTETIEPPTPIGDESHTSTQPFDEYATRAELEAKDPNRYPPFFRVFVGGTTTFRNYCARPGVGACSEFDSRPEEERVGDTIDFKSAVPYLGLVGQLELLPLARMQSPVRGLGLVAGYHRGYSETRVKVTTPTGETPTRTVVATDSTLTGMLLYRFYFNMGTESRPRLGYAGVRGGLLGREFDVDEQARAPLTGSHRLHPAAGLEFSVPLQNWFRIEGGGQFFIGPKAGTSLTADQGALELEVRDLGAEVSSSGWYAELGLAGSVWGPLGYSVRGRFTTVKDTFTGRGARSGWEQGGIAEEQHIDIVWGLTASY
jgi:hypothetical protein